MNNKILARLEKKQAGEENKAGGDRGWEHKLKEQRREEKKRRRRRRRRTRITRQRINRRRKQRKKRTHLAYESEIRRTNGTATLAYL